MCAMLQRFGPLIASVGSQLALWARHYMTPRVLCMLQVVKKVRQCDALLERKAAGSALTVPERDKLDKLPSWCVELVHCFWKCPRGA